MKLLDYSGLQRFLSKIKTLLDSKSNTGHTHTVSDVSGLSTVATSGDYGDLSNTPTIPVVNNAKLTIQRNGTTVKTFTANASSNVTANITVPTAVSELTNDSGYLTSASSLDSSKLTGTIDIARLPKGALERLVTVTDQTARFALTTSDVQLGDTVKQLDTGVMYIVTDESKLNSADGYTEYTAGSATSVPWSGVTGKPSSFTPSSHSHGNIANGGTLGTASRALITDGNKKITTSSVTSTELGYLSGVTSAVQTQLDGKSNTGHTHTTSQITDFPSNYVTTDTTQTIAGTKTFDSQIKGTIDKSKDYYLSDNTLASANGSLGTVKYYPATTTADLDTEIFEHSLWAAQKAFNSIPTALDSFYYIDQYFYLGRSSIANRIQILRGYRNANLHMVRVYNQQTYSWSEWAKFADDSDVVHKSGDETVSGTKSFNSDLNLNYSSTDVDDILDTVAGSYTAEDFLAQNNVWTGDNTFKGIYQNQGDTNYIIPRGTSTVKGDLTTSGFFSLMFKDKNNGNLATSGIGYLTFGQNSSGSYANIGVETVGSTDNTRHSNSISYKIDPTTNDNTAQFYPVNNNATDLGTSTNKWKTLNGVNPGALSLPDTLGTSGTENVNYFNVIGYLNNTGTIATIPTTATYDGWLYINAKDGAGSYIIIDDSPSAFGTSVYGNNGLGSSSVGLLCLICPIRAGHSYNVRVKSAGIVSARIYPAQGNV